MPGCFAYSKAKIGSSTPERSADHSSDRTVARSLSPLQDVEIAIEGRPRDGALVEVSSPELVFEREAFNALDLVLEDLKRVAPCLAPLGLRFRRARDQACSRSRGRAIGRSVDRNERWRNVGIAA